MNETDVTAESLTDAPAPTAGASEASESLQAETIVAEDHGSMSGMPQMDPSSFPSQLFWLTLSFVALYIVLANRILPRIQDILETRQNRITGDVGRAEEYKNQAETAREVYEKALADSRTNAQSQLNEVAEAARKKAAVQTAEMDQAIAKKMADAEAAIHASRKQALNNITPVAADLTSLIVEKFVHHKPAADKVNAVVAAVAKEKSV